MNDAPLLMRLQHRVKSAVKPLLFKDVTRARTVKAGPGRGVVALFNRRHDLQRELGLYERELHTFYRGHIRPGTVVYDIGAADGLDSLTYAALGAQVIAFEPDADALAKLERNLSLNPSASVRVVPGPYRPGYAPPADVVKIDVDGAEVEVLGALPDDASAIVIETHSEALEETCRTTLLARGYEVRIVGSAWWRRFYPEWRPTSFNRWLVAVRPSRLDG
jgi:hypothetical protein